MKSIRNRLLLMLLLFIIVPYFLTVFFIYGFTKAFKIQPLNTIKR
ncbi:hypothetical protein [Fictibacillus terranigra]|uniref:Sugar ABC transporter permease n=1 Tax=Fictibacillus terranigra TaxID=3058424 RepID=A0ABT8ED59_9BACL|nr:hypothetical protein [Fictibacillus sp. CENA-BCM004]MDN4075872.1 hypothetical protein [Fictibacillus sp. CENA-BCM004]